MNIWDRIKLAFNRKPQAPIIKASEPVDDGQFMYEVKTEIVETIQEQKVEQHIPAKKSRRPRKKKENTNEK